MWWGGGTEVWFAPSKPIFDKWFAGKKLDFAEWQASPESKHVLATFEKIGYHPRKRKAGDKDGQPKSEPKRKKRR